MNATFATRTIETLTVSGDWTLTLVPMTAAELGEWEWATETFAVTPRIAGFARLRGWSVHLADGAHLGLIITNGFDIMAEFWNSETRDYESVGRLPRVKKLIAASYLVQALERQRRAARVRSERVNLEWDIRGEWQDAERRRTGHWWIAGSDMPAALFAPLFEQRWAEHCERAQAERIAAQLGA